MTRLKIKTCTKVLCIYNSKSFFERTEILRANKILWDRSEKNEQCSNEIGLFREIKKLLTDKNKNERYTIVWEILIDHER